MSLASQNYFDSLVDILQPNNTNYSETFISLEIVKQMLDKFPEDVWYNPHLKWYDPNCNLSQFLVYVFHKLMKGLEKSIPNPKERRVHILTQMLYVSEIVPKNLEIYRKIMIKPNEDIELNIIKEPFLTLSNIEFDIILGFPPTEDKKYLTYIKKSMELLKPNGFLMFFTPTLALEYITLNMKKDCLDDFYQIRSIVNNIPNKNNYVYFLLEKEPYLYPTNIDFYLQKSLYSNPILIQKESIIPRCASEIDMKIIAKITSPDNCYDIKKFIFEDNKTIKIRKELVQKNIIREKISPDAKIKIIDMIGKGTPFPGKFFYSNKKDMDYGIDKVVFNKKGLPMPHISPKNQYTYSNNFIYITGDVMNDLYSILMLLNSDIIKYLLFQFSKNDSDNISSLKMLKKLNKPVKNVNDLYVIYNLSTLEVQRIKLISLM